MHGWRRELRIEKRGQGYANNGFSVPTDGGDFTHGYAGHEFRVRQLDYPHLLHRPP